MLSGLSKRYVGHGAPIQFYADSVLAASGSSSDAFTEAPYPASNFGYFLALPSSDTMGGSLRVSLTSSRNEVNDGGSLIYTATVVNTGATPMSGVELQVLLSSGIQLVGASSTSPWPTGAGPYSGWNSADVMTWKIGTLNQGASWTARFTVYTNSSSVDNGSILRCSALALNTAGQQATASSDVMVGTSFRIDPLGIPTIISRIIGLSGDLSFGPVAVNQAAQRTLTIRNTGNRALTVSGIQYPPGCTGNWTGGVIEQNRDQSVTVTFTPASIQSYGGTITIVSNATSGSGTINVSGAGAAPTRIISLNGNLVFGDQSIGTTSTPRNLRITNTGNSTLNVSKISYPSGLNGDWAGGTIAAGGLRDISVTFSPTTITSYSGAITVNSDKTSGESAIAVSGAGIFAPKPEIVVEQPLGNDLPRGVAKDYGAVNVGANQTLSFTIKNAGTANLTGLSVSKSGQHAADFLVAASGMSSLAPSGETSFTVSFAPLAAGPRNATIQIVSNDDDENPFVIQLTGTGVAVDPLTLTFVGTPFAPRVGNQLALDLKRLANSGETIKLVGKLPTGLKFNATTGLILGTITGKPGTYSLSVQVFQGSTLLRTIPLPITVGEFPSSLIGNFEFLLEDTNAQPRGAFRLAITKPNAWSATLEMAGAAKRTAKGSFILAPGSPVAPITAVFPAASGVPAVTVNVSIDGSAPNITGSYNGGTLRGFRLASIGERPPFTVPYSLVLEAVGEQDGLTVPAGLGWMKGTVSKLGVGTFKGLLGDGTAASLSLRLSATGQAILWSQPYTNRNSYIGGIVTLGNLGQPVSDNPTLVDGVWWYKAADGKTLSYPNGFPAMQVNLGTSKWIAPATATALGASLGWRDNRTAAVMIDGTGLDNSEPQSTTAKLPTEFTIGDKFNLVTSAPTTTPLVLWTGKAMKADGTFSGTLMLPAGFSINVPGGAAAASGVLIQDESWGAVTGCGLLKVPTSGVKGSFRTASVVLGQ